MQLLTIFSRTNSRLASYTEVRWRTPIYRTLISTGQSKVNLGLLWNPFSSIDEIAGEVNPSCGALHRYILFGFLFGLVPNSVILRKTRELRSP